MINLKKKLKEKLKDAGKIALLGIGSELRSDDAAGILVAKELEEIQGRIKGKPEFKVFIGGTAPENVTGEIKRFKPTHLIIIDSAEAGEEPGSVMLIDPGEIGGVSFSTHALPSKIMVDYLQDSLKCVIIMLGIQPKTIKFGETVSPAIVGAVKEVVKTLKEIIRD
ncbi:MAG: hydrogenase maturation peptidase HycI [Candidatus Omnitrophota bacterium]|nr:hydrogenase maturation peptidase HycI [Candidatus Omnitrophota bacterium]MBU1929373.1 hydrogenase maturation peptidase HycI [Candidatus Omnitrophota bacterium]MBU2034887.1 hydrogenase maturation peptidase HycI [Candidatus Omnitrophota bacterium]MBU2258870.1 hydrogenase maturation peptidase HycI [Candidatus Omnitrophota bacterium]